ncbi:hypothetical protein KUDE01_029193, partial [Dissostichus eleginoides]
GTAEAPRSPSLAAWAGLRFRWGSPRCLCVRHRLTISINTFGWMQRSKGHHVLLYILPRDLQIGSVSLTITPPPTTQSPCWDTAAAAAPLEPAESRGPEREESRRSN